MQIFSTLQIVLTSINFPSLSVLRPEQLTIPYFPEEKESPPLDLNDVCFSPLGKEVSCTFEITDVESQENSSASKLLDIIKSIIKKYFTKQ